MAAVRTVSSAVRTVRTAVRTSISVQKISCTTLDFCAENLLYGPWFLCRKSAYTVLDFCAEILLYGLDFCAQLLYGFPGTSCPTAVRPPQINYYKLPWNACQAAASFSSCSEISLALLLSLSFNLLMKEWMTFSSLNLTLSDFWVIPKSNRWNRLRSRAEIKCSFKSHFLFFNSPHFNKDPLSHLFPKSLFLSNFTLTLLESL